MPATQPTTLFSLDVVRAYIVRTGSTADDVALVQIADAVSARFETRTGRVFVTRTLADVWDGDGRPDHYLAQRPVAALASLSVDGVALAVGIDYYVYAASGRVALLQGAFDRGVANCAAGYTAGFGPQDDPGLPQDVYEAGLEWCKVVYDEKVTNAVAASSVTVGASGFVLKPGLPPGIKDVIADWKDVRA